MPAGKQLTISASALSKLYFCNRKMWLDIHGNRLEKDKPHFEQQMRFLKGIDHEKKVHEATTDRIIPISASTWAEGVELTRAQMAEGVTGILHGFLEYTIVVGGVFVTIRGRPDRLIRIKLKKPSIWVYAPIEIKHAKKVQQSDEIQLDCYIWLLTHIQAFRPPAQLWMGRQPDGQPLERITHRYDHERFTNALETVVRYYLQSVEEPKAHIDSRCDRCEWRTKCSKHAEATYDVSLIHRLGQAQTSLNEGGIFTLNQLIELSPDELRQFKYIKTLAERFHAHARAWLEDQPIVYREIPEVCTGDAWHFDIEFEANNSEKGVWSIGWNRNNEQPQVVLVVPEQEPTEFVISTGQQVYTVPNSDEAWRVFANSVSVDDSPILHWTSVEKSMIEKTAPDDVKFILQHRLSDLYKHCYDTVTFPIYSTSIKTIANYLGFYYSAYSDYIMAHMDYEQWLKTGDETSLHNTCAYQSDDVMAMAVVRQWMMDNAL